MKGFIVYFVVACLCGIALGESFYGAFIVPPSTPHVSRRNTIEYVFLKNGTIDISFTILPETAKMQLLICSEIQQNKLEENDQSLECEVSKKVDCEYVNPSVRSLTLHHNVTYYGRYFIHLLPCTYTSTAVVNWTASFVNGVNGVGGRDGSQLDALLIPASPTFRAMGLLWCLLAIAYLFTLRRHWKKAQRIQKFIAAYPIVKVVFAYYGASFYIKYGINGAFTTYSWAWYWTFSIGLQLGLDVLLMLLSKTGSNGVRVSIFDIVTIIGITAGQALLSVLQCSSDVSQLAHLLMWITQTTLYVMMVCYILSGMTRRLQKTANILRYSIRHSTQATRHRLNRLRTDHVRQLERQQQHERQQRARRQAHEEGAQEGAQGQASESSEHESKEMESVAENGSPLQDIAHNSNDNNNNTNDKADSNDNTDHNNTNNNNINDDNTNSNNKTDNDIEIINNTEITETTTTTATNNNSNTDNNNDNNNNDNNNYSNTPVSEPDSALSRLESSISYMLPYIWFMRHQLFVSFMFVLIVWIVLQIAMYFVNLLFGSPSLNWVKLLTTEVVDFVVFSGIIYTFTMSSRPFTISTRQDSSDRTDATYIPLGPISSRSSENDGEDREDREDHEEGVNAREGGRRSTVDAEEEEEEDDDEAEDRPLRRLPRVGRQ